MTAPTQRRAARDPASHLEESHERCASIRQRAAIQPAQTDVEELPFPKAPAVAFEVVAVVQLGALGSDRPAVGVSSRNRKLCFLRNDQRVSRNGWIQPPGD